MTKLGPTIHIVDDDASFRSAVGALLDASGYRVSTYESAKQLLSAPPNDDVACILLDVRMAGLSGPQLQNRLTELGCKLPVVFLSGHADIPTTVQTIKAGAEDFLTKPVKKEKLLAALERALARHKVQREQDNQTSLLRSLFGQLTRREQEVFRLLVQGKPHKQIAHELGISDRTVKLHRHQIVQKLEVRSLAEFAVIAEHLSLISRGNGKSDLENDTSTDWAACRPAADMADPSQMGRFHLITFLSRCSVTKATDMPKRHTTVAVVDDDASMLKAAAELLYASGFAVSLFGSAEEFLRNDAANKVDCLLLDIHFDGLSGIELRQRLKLSWPELPVIFMTALDDEKVRQQALQTGCIACLRKPFPARQLIDAIAKGIAGVN